MQFSGQYCIFIQSKGSFSDVERGYCLRAEGLFDMSRRATAREPHGFPASGVPPYGE